MFEMLEIESYKMDWKTGQMTHRFLVNGVWEEEVTQALSPDNPFCKVMSNRLKRK